MFKPSKPQHIATKAYSDSTVVLAIKYSEEKGYGYIEDNAVQKMMKANPPKIVELFYDGVQSATNYFYLTMAFNGSVEWLGGIHNGEQDAVVLQNTNSLLTYLDGVSTTFHYNAEDGVWTNEKAMPGTGGNDDEGGGTGGTGGNDDEGGGEKK